jgi:GTPase
MNPESDTGNVEYKLFINTNVPDRLEELTTQMRYRLNEGHGECFYIIGVKDNGNIIGITEEEFNISDGLLKDIANKLDVNITLLSSKDITSSKKMYEYLIREKNNKYIEIKVGIAGGVDCGKSTLLSVLSKGEPDNGRGSARLAVFNHRHEITTGRTSSISHHIMGFDDKGKVINGMKMEWEDIVKKSSKIISFYDLAGHEMYLKTTIYGLNSSKPDLCFILVGSNMGLNIMTKEHLSLCNSLNIPTVIILTKVDLCETRENVLQNTVNDIKELVKLTRKVFYEVKTNEDARLCSQNIHSNNIVPIFQISNVSKKGISELVYFLNLVSPRKRRNREEDPTELFVDTIFNIPGIGLVIGGHLLCGKIKLGDTLKIGPTNEGEYYHIVIKGIHCKRVSVDSISCGSGGTYVCLNVSNSQKNRKRLDKTVKLRRGMVVLNSDTKIQDTTIKEACREFYAELYIIKTHATTIKKGYQPILHMNNIRQAVEILEIQEKDILRANDKALVKLRFMFRPEYVSINSRLMFCEGRVRGIGKVVKIDF